MSLAWVVFNFLTSLGLLYIYTPNIYFGFTPVVGVSLNVYANLYLYNVLKSVGLSYYTLVSLSSLVHSS